jgi:flagellar biosynthesis protein FliR
VEHNLKVALSLATRIYLMGKAHIGFKGTIQEFESNKEVWKNISKYEIFSGIPLGKIIRLLYLAVFIAGYFFYFHVNLSFIIFLERNRRAYAGNSN